MIGAVELTLKMTVLFSPGPEMTRLVSLGRLLNCDTRLLQFKVRIVSNMSGPFGEELGLLSVEVFSWRYCLLVCTSAKRSQIPRIFNLWFDFEESAFS